MIKCYPVTEGKDQAFTPTFYDQEGNVMPDQSEKWFSTENPVATLNGRFVATAVGAGETIISFTIMGLNTIVKLARKLELE